MDIRQQIAQAIFGGGGLQFPAPQSPEQRRAARQAQMMQMLGAPGMPSGAAGPTPDQLRARALQNMMGSTSASMGLPPNREAQFQAAQGYRNPNAGLPQDVQPAQDWRFRARPTGGLIPDGIKLTATRRF